MPILSTLSHHQFIMKDKCFSYRWLPIVPIQPRLESTWHGTETLLKGGILPLLESLLPSILLSAISFLFPYLSVEIGWLLIRPILFLSLLPCKIQVILFLSLLPCKIQVILFLLPSSPVKFRPRRRSRLHRLGHMEGRAIFASPHSHENSTAQVGTQHSSSLSRFRMF